MLSYEERVMTAIDRKASIQYWRENENLAAVINGGILYQLK